MVHITRSEFTYTSALPGFEIFVRAWMPAQQPVRAVVQIVHGMAEHGERYEPFAQFLCDAGIAVWCSDLLGHGRSVRTEDDLGWFGSHKGEGWQVWKKDVLHLNQAIRERCGADTPLILFGHSMGSFIARAYVEAYPNDVSGACFCGTSGAVAGAAAAVILCKAVIATFGARYRSATLDSVLFERNNRRIPGTPRTKFDWLCTDSVQVDKYIDDEKCGFLFTAGGYLDLLRLMQHVTRKQWYGSMHHLFPMLLISGAEDPVGDYGKGVRYTYKKLREAGKNKTSMTLFERMRHEILLESDCVTVFSAILDWIEKSILSDVQHGEQASP
jgi:alpha-beta hydrolase superfamily lysophospholipase